MSKLCTLLFALLLSFSLLECAPERPQHIDPTVWTHVEPYVIPENHPIKAKLDRLFSSSRILLNEQSIKKAGFEKTKPGKFSHAIVSKNSKFKNYYFKMFADNQLGLSDWQQWVTRARAAQMTAASIKAHGYHYYFSVPQKWIYVLPEFPGPPPGYERKNFLLVEEDMQILKKSDNYAKWKSSTIKPAILDALYVILKEQGLSDSVYAFNIPFNRYGFICFIDTEHHQQANVAFDRLTNYLSSSNRNYWTQLILDGGPK